MELFARDAQEWTTLAQVQPARRRRWSFALCTSLTVHAVIVVILCLPTVPLFIKPRLIAHGEGGSATPSSIVLYVPNDLQLLAEKRPSLLSLPTRLQKPAHKSRLHKRTNTLEVEKPTSTAEAGSELGSASDGLASGDEIKPALPAAFQNDKIPRSELPSGIRGDVIVEITIDAEGKVIEEKLLQGVGSGVDERVIALVRDWRYRPATRNGIAIPSKRDVHFHFPS